MVLAAAMVRAGANADEIVLENAEVRAVVSLKNAARLVRFTDLKDGRELVDGKVGACRELFPANQHPGIFDTVRYGVVRADKAEAVLSGGFQDARLGYDFSMEKTFRLDGRTVQVSFALTNNGKEVPFSLRIQCATPRTDQIFTMPVKDGVRVIYPERRSKVDLTTWIVHSWGAVVSRKERNGLLFRFGKVQKFSHHVGENFLALECTLFPGTIGTGETKTFDYSLIDLPHTLPVVMADKDNVLGLMPPVLKNGFDYELSAVSLTGGACTVTADGFAEASAYSTKGEYAGCGTLKLPWTNIIIDRMKLKLNGSAVDLKKTNCNEDITLPPVPDLSGVEIQRFFPYGDYGNAGLYTPNGVKEPSSTNSFRRVYEMMRKSYFNTVTTGGMIWPPPRQREFEKTGRSTVAEAAVACGLKIIPRMETLHGRKQEKYTCEDDVRKDLERRGFKLETLKGMFTHYRDAILLHDLADEPYAQWVGDYVLVQEFFRKNIDPVRPTSPIFNLSTRIYLPYVPVFYGDEYGCHHASSNPYKGKRIRETVEAAGEKPVWVMLQGFGMMKNDRFDWRLPTEAEIRHMIYATVAGGAKGITYHYNPHAVRWRQAFYSDAALDQNGFETPTWRAMAEAGRRLTAIGSLLVAARLKDERPLESATVGDAKGNYYGPAIRTGALKLDELGGGLLVAVNYDLENEQASRLKLNPGNDGDKALVDLFSDDLKAVGGVIDLPFTLKPGDGRIWYFGSRAGARQAINLTHLGRARNEYDIVNIDLRHAAVNGVDVSGVARLLERTSAALEKNDGRVAWTMVSSARTTLDAAVSRTADYARAKAGLDALHRTLEAVNELFRTRSEDFFTLGGKKLKPGTLLQKEGDDRANGVIAAMDRLAFRLIQLKDEVYFNGRAKECLGEIDGLRPEAETLLKNALEVTGK